MTPSIPSTLPAVLTESQAEQLLDVAEQAVATNQYKGDGGAAAASGSGSGKAVGKTADKSADTVNRNEAPAVQTSATAPRVVAESQRNAAILELLYATGIRVAELVSMDIVDVDFSNRTIKVTGKGNKQRVVPFGLPAQRALETWLEQGRPVLARTATDAAKSRATNALFLGARGGRIDQRIARDIVHRAAREAGVPDISPHALRHSAATHHAGRRCRSEGGAGDARAFLLENYTTLYARLHRAAQEPLRTGLSPGMTTMWALVNKLSKD